jgi:hypothetical protein
VGLLVGEVCTKPPTHAGDGAAEVTSPRCGVDVEPCCQIMLAMVLSR